MIGFWQSKDKAFRTSTRGLSQDQIDFLQSLRVGDRLVIFPAKGSESKNFPDLTLLKSEQREQNRTEIPF